MNTRLSRRLTSAHLLIRQACVGLHVIPRQHISLHRESQCRTFIKLPFSNNDVQTHKVSKVVQASPKQIYDVVSNVGLYHEFVPFVEESYIEKKTENSTIAGLRVGWKQYDEKFECKLTCKPYESVIAESLTISLFSELHTCWTFRPRKALHGESCNVDLELKYKFKNPLYNAMSSLFSDQVTSIMIKAFESRVKKIAYQNKKNILS